MEDVVAKLSASADDKAAVVASGELTAVGAGEAFSIRGTFNFTLGGTFVGKGVLERSFDGGTNYIVLTAAGTQIVFEGPATEVCDEPERNVLYRFRCTEYTSGTMEWRASK